MVAAGLPAAIENPGESPKNEFECRGASSLDVRLRAFHWFIAQECREIASCAHVLTFARNELLFVQGQPVRNLVLIQTGSVKLFAAKSQWRGGHSLDERIRRYGLFTR